jgi:glutaredoxin
MKKLLFLALIVCGGIAAAFLASDWRTSDKAAFDQNGKALAYLYTGPDCGKDCALIAGAMKERGIVFEEINLLGSDGRPVKNNHGVRGYPTAVVGKQLVEGVDMPGLSAALAEAYGKAGLTQRERVGMEGHFDKQGKPKVVMYGTTWCGYCAKQRALFAAKGVQFEDVNVEASKPGQLAFTALQGNGIPLTYVGYRRFDGYREADLLAAIDELIKAKPASVR